jgi:hypothetical protein
MTYGDMLYKSSPQYLTAFKDGFDCAKREMVDILADALRKIEKLEAIQETSGTTEIS